MNSYSVFAQYYDRLTENAQYKVRSEYISNLFSRYGNGKKKVLDLACGTGTISKFLIDFGYDVTGVDLSEDMLINASSKSDKLKLFKADITNFNLGEKFDFCLSSLDSINHLDSLDKVVNCFKTVANHLVSSGIFVFDVNTIYKHNEILANNTFVFDEDDFFLSWDNENLGDNTVRIILDFFIFNGRNYDRFTEEFCEKAYSINALKSALSDFDIICINDDLSENPPKDDSQRIYFVCRRK